MIIYLNIIYCIARSNSTQAVIQATQAVQTAYDLLQSSLKTANNLASIIQAQAGKGTQAAQDAAQNAYNQAKQAIDDAVAKFNSAVAKFNQIIG
jgi:hypothetical protein